MGDRRLIPDDSATRGLTRLSWFATAKKCVYCQQRSKRRDWAYREEHVRNDELPRHLRVLPRIPSSNPRMVKITATCPTCKRQTITRRRDIPHPFD